MAETQQTPPTPTVAELADAGVPTFYVSSFNLSATSNEVVVIGNELYPSWAPDGSTQAPVLRPRVLMRLSPQSAKDLTAILHNFVSSYEANYGELRTDFLLRQASPG